jgi:type II secretory ATPase GspE/PulE/Tfp pilus assembly ATPase PilB-like protein
MSALPIAPLLKSPNPMTMVGHVATAALGHIRGFADVPPFASVLSHGAKPVVQLHAEKKSSVFVVSTEDKGFYVFSLPREQGTPMWFHVVDQAKRQGYRLVGSYVIEAEVLDILVREHADKDISSTRQQKKQDKEVFESIIAGSDLIEWFRDQIALCMKLGATDIHIEVRGDMAAMRIRRDGIMRLIRHYPASLCTKALSTYYTLLAEERSRSEVAFNVLSIQSAMIPLVVNGRGISLRYQSHPSVGGYEVVIRILKTDQHTSSKPPDLEQLGYTPDQVETLNEALGSSSGGIFIAGITGSGKTTTLSAMLSRLAREGNRKIVAIEDPVEYIVPGVSHLSIQRSAQGSQGSATENPFSASMMAFLRMDPDIGMFGEIRDSVSGGMAYTAIQTGHKLLTTVHATSALGIVARLTSQHIGLLREDVCSPEFLSLLMYQVLIPKNCIHCNVPADQVMSAVELAAYEHHFQLDPKQFRCASDTGCAHCQVEGLDRGEQTHVGVNGVKVCAEVMPITNDLLRLLRVKDDIRARDEWLALRNTPFDNEDMVGKEAWGHALYEVSQGVLDPFHFERNFGPPGLLALSRNLK